MSTNTIVKMALATMVVSAGISYLSGMDSRVADATRSESQGFMSKLFSMF